MSRAPVLLAARNVRKAFSIGDRRIEVLHGVHLELRKGELLGLVGASGAGKSTLLHVLGLLDPPTEGQVLLDGQDAWKLTTLERARLRNTQIGFVFQFYHLLPELSALENAMLPGRNACGRGEFRRRRRALEDRARETLDRFGLSKRLGHRPGQLSGGEQQRVALARAMLLDPPILIADEPTGNLDSATGEKVLELLLDEQERTGTALLLVTHDERVARSCQRIVFMEDGQVQGDSGTVIPQ
jgi:lipoprotein-releasing system ATP-binding protein